MKKDTANHHPRTSGKRKVLYADEPFSFEVKPKNAKGSVVGDTQNCAAACALKALPGIDKAWVTRTRTVLEFSEDHPQHPGEILRFKSPVVLQRAVEQFDSTAGLFPPGKYTLTPVTVSQRRTDRKASNRDGSRPASRRKRPAYAIR